MVDQCGLPVELVNGIHNIWIALASGLPIDPEKFDSYCKNVANIYETALDDGKGGVWYPMCPSLHKILYHGGEIIRLLPPSIFVGMLSEEPSEGYIHKLRRKTHLNKMYVYQ